MVHLRSDVSVLVFIRTSEGRNVNRKRRFLSEGYKNIHNYSPEPSDRLFMATVTVQAAMLNLTKASSIAGGRHVEIWAHSAANYDYKMSGFQFVFVFLIDHLMI